MCNICTTNITKKVIKHIKKELQNTDEENQRSKKNGEMVI